MDALAEEYGAWSPYNYVVGNPMNLIDPNGHEPWKPIGNGKWKAESGDSAFTLAKDAGISLSEADKIVQSQHGPNYVREDGMLMSDTEIGDIVQVGGLSISETASEARGTSSSNNSNEEEGSSKLPGIISDGVSGAGEGISQVGGYIAYSRSSGRVYLKPNARGLNLLNGRSASNAQVGRVAGRLGVAGSVILGGYDIGTNAYQEGGFGPETQKATGRTAGGLAGGWAGAKAGAILGAPAGPWGILGGGIIGGILGGLGGSVLGEEVVETIQDN